MGCGKGKNGQTLRQIFFHPSSQLGRGGGMRGDNFLEPSLSTGQIGAIENAANGLGNFGALIQARDISLGILLEMILAALPGHGGKHGLAGGAQAGMVIADQQHAVRIRFAASSEGAPMHLGQLRAT